MTPRNCLLGQVYGLVDHHSVCTLTYMAMLVVVMTTIEVVEPLKASSQSEFDILAIRSFSLKYIHIKINK